MSGHSKWSQIKRQKGATDQKRGQVFSKLAKIVAVAAKHGGPDPAMNPRLRIAVEQARAENMPKDNIERAIKRGTGELGGATIEELRFEAYGPGGVALLIDVATDNHARATAEIKATLNKYDGKLAATGAVAYQFVQQGELFLPQQGQPLLAEELELLLIELGVESYEWIGKNLRVTVDPKHLSELKVDLLKQNIIVGESKIVWEPSQTVAMADETQARQLLRLTSALEDLEDVTGVTANVDLSDQLAEQLAN